MIKPIVRYLRRLLRHPFRRRALTKPNLPYFCWRYIGNARRTLWALRANYSYDDAPLMAREIQEQGIIKGASDQFLSPEGNWAISETSKLILDLSRNSDVQATVAKGTSEYKKPYVINLIKWEHEHSINSPVIRLALDKKVLEIVSAYLGLCPRLHAIGAWLNFPTDNAPAQAQLWHRDPEDMKLIKAFIYLKDVTETSGPFTYIPKTHPFSAGSAVSLGQSSDNITDAEMSVAFPPETWLPCTGPAGTMILADTVGYHRGGRVTDGNRILITFTYTSGVPLSDRRLRVRGRPEWVMDEIQRMAL